MNWVDLKLEYLCCMAQVDGSTEYQFEDYANQYDFNSEALKSSLNGNSRGQNPYTIPVLLTDNFNIKKDYIYTKSGTYYIKCPNCKGFAPAFVSHAKYNVMPINYTIENYSDSYYYYHQYLDTATTYNFNTKHCYAFTCVKCRYQTSSNQSIISNFSKWILIPKSVSHYSDQDKVTLKVVFDKTKLISEDLMFINFEIKINFNTRTGRTNLIINDQNIDGSISKKRYRNILKALFYTNNKEILHAVYYIESLLDIDFKNKLSNTIKNTLIKRMTEVRANPQTIIGNGTTTGTATIYWESAITSSSTLNLNTIYENHISLFDLILYNRYPKIQSADITALRDYSVFTNSPQMGYLLNTCLKMKNTDNPVKYLMDVFKISHKKSLARVFYKDLLSIFKYPMAATYFKDINNLVRVVSKMNKRISIEDIRKWTRGMYTYKEKFLDLLFQKYTETEVCNKIINKSHFYKDCVLLYNKILDKGHNVDISEIKGNLHDIHDYLSYKYDIIATVNHPLRSRIIKEYLWLEKKFENGYSLRFAEDTHELKTIGRYLKMCVGAYDDKAYDGRCHIIFLEKNRKYIACIELSGDYKYILQVKGIKNQLLEGEPKEVVTSWILANKLLLDTSDIEINTINN